MKKYFITALAILFLSTQSYASWLSQGYIEDTAPDGTEKVFTENGLGTDNNWMSLSTVQSWLKGTDDNYVTDAQLIVIGNTSGTNTGDQTIPTVSDAVYGIGWNASTDAATKNAIYDKIETIAGGSMTYPGAGIPLSTGAAWGTSYSLTTLAAALDGEAWTFTGAVDLTGTSSLIMGQVAFDGSTVGDGIVTLFSVTNPTTVSKSISLGNFDMRIPAATAVNTDGSIVGMTTEIASGTATLGTTAIADGACATAVTVTATGVATTDVVNPGYNATPVGITGYDPTAASLSIIPYPTANNVNFLVCNTTGAAITPGAMTINWRVDR